MREVLQQADEEERHLVVRKLTRVDGGSASRARRNDVTTYLLPETDARPRVEREEDERVWREVFLHSFVEESVGVELQG